MTLPVAIIGVPILMIIGLDRYRVRDLLHYRCMTNDELERIIADAETSLAESCRRSHAYRRSSRLIASAVSEKQRRAAFSL